LAARVDLRAALPEPAAAMQGREPVRVVDTTVAAQAITVAVQVTTVAERARIAVERHAPAARWVVLVVAATAVLVVAAMAVREVAARAGPAWADRAA
jgi:hypothetical protein